MAGNSQRFLRALSAFLLFAAVAPGAAHAQDSTKVAVLTVEGPQGEKAFHEAVKLVKKQFTLVTNADWEASAAKLFATSRSASDLAAVAADLGVQVIITGKVKKEEGSGWELSMSVRQGATGKSTSKLKYPLKGPHVDPATLKKLAEELTPAINEAAAAPPPDATQNPSAATGTTGDDTEAPVGDTVKDKDKEKAGPLASTRPEWSNWIDASFGAAISGRSLSFSQPNLPNFAQSAAGGILLDATVYPLAFLAEKPGKVAIASGLGIGATYGSNFGPASNPCYATSTGTCEPTVDSYKTIEYRYEVGLRWKWNILRRFDRPELRVNVAYGQHVFAIQQRQYLEDVYASGKPVIGPRDIGPPNVAYSYVTIGVGGLFPVFTRQSDVMKRIALFLDFNFHVPFDTGTFQTAAEWGAGSAIGLRLDGGLELRLWKGLFARIYGQMEYFGLSFNQPATSKNIAPPCPCGTTGSATDLYYGGVLAVGYAY